MTVTEDTITKINVFYCSHHSNPEPEICHLRVPEEVKNVVAAKLAEGVAIDRVLDDNRDSVSGTIERKHLMNQQDILTLNTNLTFKVLRNIKMTAQVYQHGLLKWRKWNRILF